MKKTKALSSILLAIISVFTLLIIPVHAASKNPWDTYPEPTRAIYYKNPVMTGSDVKWVQTSLNTTINAGLAIDGSFGPASKKATKTFQKKYGLSQDGSFGPATKAKMISVLNSKGYYNRPVSNSKSWMWPCKVQSQSCEWWDTYYHKSHAHRGIDIRASYADVYASRAGTLYQMGYNKARGYWIVIDHGDGYYSEYQHLNKYKVSSGTYVKQGSVIAQSGNTGEGSGAHLHFEIMNLGKTGLAKNYGKYFNCTSKFVNVNPQKSTYAHFYKSNGKWVNYFSDTKGINYKYK